MDALRASHSAPRRGGRIRDARRTASRAGFTLVEVSLAVALLGVVGDHDTLWKGGRPLAETLGWPGGGDRSVQRYGRLAFITLGVEGDAADLPFPRSALARTRDADARCFFQLNEAVFNPLKRWRQ